MFSLKDIIFSFWGVYDALTDTNKINGKGFLQRFVELLAGDLDDNETSAINNIVENTVSPLTAQEKFLPYQEDNFGGLLDMVSGPYMKRKVLQHAAALHRRRSTPSGYEILLRWLGFETATVVSLTNNFGFDSPVTFDDPIRRFDMKCATCARYSIELTGAISVTPEIYQAVMNIIEFNEPIDMQLLEITYNGNPFVVDSVNSLLLQNGGYLELQNGEILETQAS